MTKYTIIENGLTEEEQIKFQSFYPGHIVTRDLLQIDSVSDGGNSGSMIRVIIVKGDWTPHGCARDCGKYYIKSNYSSYDKLEKFYGTSLITKVIKDVEDR